MARSVMIALGFFFSRLVLAMEGPIVIHHDMEGEQDRRVLDAQLIEGGYTGTEWMTAAELASTIEVVSIEDGDVCEKSVEVRVWLERLDRMEMRIQILDIPNALELGHRLGTDQVCLDGIPERRDLQRLAVNAARAHLMSAQTAETQEDVAEARMWAKESMEGLARLGEDLLLPAGLEPELQEMMIEVVEQERSLVAGAGPDGRLFIDGQRIASGVVRRRPGVHLVQVNDPKLGEVVAASMVDMGPGRVFLWAGRIEEGAVERELRAALLGTSVEPMLLRGLASGLGRPLFFVSSEQGSDTLLRADGSPLVPEEQSARSQASVHPISKKMAIGVGPSVGGQISREGQRTEPRGMAGVSGWARFSPKPGMFLVGGVAMRAREDPLPAELEQVWTTTWELPVRLGVRFLPGDAVWETGIDGVLRWVGSTSVELQSGVCLVLGRRASLGQNGLLLRTEAHGGGGPGWVGAGLRTGVEVPW